jgi:thiamine-monophosphate kinase
VPRATGCTVERALTDGEDYELLFALAPRNSARLEREWPRAFPKLPLTRIGAFNRKSEIRNLRSLRGFDHFA